MKGKRIEKEDKNFLVLLTLIAYKYGEITRGRAIELLGMSQEEIDELAKARCGGMCGICNNQCKEMWRESP